MPKKESYFDRLKGVFSRISKEEIETLAEHLSRAWKSEELIPQPNGYILIPMERIEEPQDPVRKELGDLEEMKGSIEREDVLQPIVVTPMDPEWRKFRPIIGLRRYRACEELQREKIPAYVLEIGEDEDLEEVAASLALEENRFRKDLAQPELLQAMLSLRDDGRTVEEIAERAGMAKSAVSVYLRIPELPKEAREAFLSGEISFQHVGALMGFKKKDQLELLRRIREEGLSGSDAQMIAQMRRGKIELPKFFNSREFEGHLGSNLEFRRGKRSVSLTLRASNEEEMREVLEKILDLKKFGK